MKNKQIEPRPPSALVPIFHPPPLSLSFTLPLPFHPSLPLSLSLSLSLFLSLSLPPPRLANRETLSTSTLLLYPSVSNPTQ